MKNLDWANKIILKVDKNFKHKWDLYNDTLLNHFERETIWLDCGCGNDLISEEYEHLVKQAVNIDVLKPKVKRKNYINADLKFMPVKSGSADLITLRFVVEHFEVREPYLNEWDRILKSGGRIIIVTTNLLSPLIFIPKLIPDLFRRIFLSVFFKVSEDDVFKAYHKFNTPAFYRGLNDKFRIKEIKYLSDLNYIRKWFFMLLLSFHLITRVKFLKLFRTNLLVVLEKKLQTEENVEFMS